MLNPLNQQHCRHLLFLTAIVGGAVVGGPVTGAVVGGVAAAGLVSLLGNLWAGELAANRAAKMAGPAYAHPNHDLARLLGDAVARALRQQGEADPSQAPGLNRLAAAAEAHNLDLATRPEMASVSTDRLPRLLEAAARGGRDAIDLLDDRVAVPGPPGQRTVAWLLVDYLGGTTKPPLATADPLRAVAERAIITGLFAAVREMLKRSPAKGGRAYAALQLDVNGEILARLGDLARDRRQDLQAGGVHADALKAVRDAIDRQQDDLRDAIDFTVRASMGPILDQFRAARDGFDQVFFQLWLIREKQDEHSRDHADMMAVLRLIEQRQQSAIQANPTAAPPPLSDADRATLDEAKRVGDLRTRAAASVLQPDDQTDALLGELRARHEADAFDLHLLEGKRWYFAGESDRAVEAFVAAMRLRPDHFEARNYVVLSHSNANRGDIAAHCHRAIDVAEATLGTVPFHSTDWARTQNNLGNAWRDLPTGDRAGNLQRAITAYTAALEVRTPTADPAGWAMIQNNLGIAWANLPTGDRAENLQRALTAFGNALEVRTREAHPVGWAMTQNNLGNAWGILSTGDPADNLRRAIDAYTAALEVYTRAAHPARWAMLWHNLGVAWAEMPTGDRAENLRQAIAAFTAALEVYTRAAHPADWALCWNSLVDDRTSSESR